jgi:hypothetical protein
LDNAADAARPNQVMMYGSQLTLAERRTAGQNTLPI